MVVARGENKAAERWKNENLIFLFSTFVRQSPLTTFNLGKILHRRESFSIPTVGSAVVKWEKAIRIGQPRSTKALCQHTYYHHLLLPYPRRHHEILHHRSQELLVAPAFAR